MVVAGSTKRKLAPSCALLNARFKLFVAQKPLQASASAEELKAMKELGLTSDDRRRVWLINEREKAYQQASGQANARRAYEKEVC